MKVSTFLTSGDLSEMKARIERFFDLDEGDLSSDDFFKGLPEAYRMRPQATTEFLDSVDIEVVASLRNQVLHDMCRMMKALEMVYGEEQEQG